MKVLKKNIALIMCMVIVFQSYNIAINLEGNDKYRIKKYNIGVKGADDATADCRQRVCG